MTDLAPIIIDDTNQFSCIKAMAEAAAYDSIHYELLDTLSDAEISDVIDLRLPTYIHIAEAMILALTMQQEELTPL